MKKTAEYWLCHFGFDFACEITLALWFEALAEPEWKDRELSVMSSDSPAIWLTAAVMQSWKGFPVLG